MKNNRTAAILERSLYAIGGASLSDLRINKDRLTPVYERGWGSRVWDVDGNEYIDYLLGGGPMVLGHCHPAVVEAMRNQLEKGIMFGVQTELDVRLAERIQELVPCAEIVRFGCTGSEVNHSALRLARGVTGRSKVLRFEGHYHGWYDTMGWDSGFATGDAGPRRTPHLRSLSPAQPVWAGQDWMILPWNDLDLVRDLFRRKGNDIAAIITEPVMSQGAIAPLPGFLEGLRQVCEQWGSLLIFDEVVTGFRFALGGAQAYYGVTPDLATFAKSMGSGVTVSALAGREDVMGRLREFAPIVAGTYNGNPLSMAGALATIEALSMSGGRLLKQSHETSELLAERIKGICRSASQPLAVRKFPGSIHLSYVPEAKHPITDARTLMQTDFRMTQELAYALQRRGVRVAGSGGWGLTAVHSMEDVNETIPKLAEAAAEVESLGLECTPHVSEACSNSNRGIGAASYIRRILRV